VHIKEVGIRTRGRCWCQESPHPPPPITALFVYVYNKAREYSIRKLLRKRRQKCYLHGNVFKKYLFPDDNDYRPMSSNSFFLCVYAFYIVSLKGLPHKIFNMFFDFLKTNRYFSNRRWSLEKFYLAQYILCSFTKFYFTSCKRLFRIFTDFPELFCCILEHMFQSRMGATNSFSNDLQNMSTLTRRL
jgi:hypothetical protein